MPIEKRIITDDELREKQYKLLSEISEVNAEILKISRKGFLIPFTIYAGFIVAVVTAVSLTWDMSGLCTKRSVRF